METTGLFVLLLVSISVCSAQTNIFPDFVCNSFGGFFPKNCQKTDGAWGSWGSFSECSSTCGEGTRNRTRECDNPPASNGGAECPEIDRAFIEWDDCNITACPVDGGWGSWGGYSVCTVRCGGVGTRYRERVCDNPSASDGGAPCSIVPVGEKETIKCITGSCPVPGNWGPWSEFSACSRTCDGGTKERTRKCNDPPPTNGGADCPNSNTDNSERSECNELKCPVHGGWSSWGEFSECVKGAKTRSRVCNNPSPSKDGDPCDGDGSDSQSCTDQPTSKAVNGGWGAWTPFSKCTKTCDGGTQERTRPCDDPSPSNGGADCPNSNIDNFEKKACNTGPCPVDGEWGSWGGYSGCTVTCGGGTSTRVRACDNPKAAHGGSPCPPDSPMIRNDKVTCNSNECPVSGNWGPWKDYSACSRTCEGGTQERTRECNDPSPSNGGADCPNSNTDNSSIRVCNNNPCPVDGNWGSWGPYSGCSVSCGGGTYVRQRACNNPSSSNGGKQCLTGSPTEEVKCNTNPCPVNGGYGSWTGFDTCSVSCGGGSQKRTRLCDSPVPSNGGASCPQPSKEYKSCNTQSCFAANCQDSGYEFDQKTFTCVKFVTTEKNYNDALIECGKESARLFVMDTTDKFTLLSLYADAVGIRNVYVGAKKSSGDYYWNGINRIVTWIGKHPVDQKTCVQIVGTTGYEMTAVMCDKESSYVCEYSI